MLRSLRLLLSSASLSLPAAFFPSEAVTTTPTTTITTITTTTTARSIPGAPLAPGLGGPHAWLVPKSELPLHTEGRYIAGRGGERVKWACVNWYGAYSETMTPGGLEVRPLDQIVARIVELGFNCVRLCYSTQAQLENPILRKEDLLMNPDLWGKRFLDVWDATVSAITDKGLMLIVNNQVHKSGWCCHWTQDEGLWYVPGYPESVWIESLVNMTLRHRANPLVVAIDLRNEVHDYQGVSLTWGDGNPDTDWAQAAARAGNAVLAANPDVLVVVMALCFGMDLRAMRDAPLELDIPHRVVYQTHNYLEYQLWSLISQGFVSWRTISLGTGFSAAAVAIVLVALIAAWIRLGKPWPVLPSLVVTFGSWLSVLTLVGVAICQACLFIVTQAPGCGSWGRRDVVPARNWLLVFAALGALLAIFGVLLCMRLRPAASVVGSAAADGSSHEEDDEDGSLDSDTEDNTSHEPAGGYKSCIRRLCGSPDCWSCRRIAADTLSAPLLARCVGSCAGQGRSNGNASAGLAQAPAWDFGLCCGLQCFIFLSVAQLFLISIFIFSFVAPTYWLHETHMNNFWGFALQQGHPWTAPVWMGEFGNEVRGHYWNNMMRYLSEYDVDFAYWAINGLKWTTGRIDITTGSWIPEEPHWSNETYGLLEADYWTIRRPWRLTDLQTLMPSPAQWRPLAPACDRQVLGSECGD